VVQADNPRSSNVQSPVRGASSRTLRKLRAENSAAAALDGMESLTTAVRESICSGRAAQARQSAAMQLQTGAAEHVELRRIALEERRLRLEKLQAAKAVALGRMNVLKDIYAVTIDPAILEQIGAVGTPGSGDQSGETPRE